MLENCVHGDNPEFNGMEIIFQQTRFDVGNTAAERKEKDVQAIMVSE